MNYLHILAVLFALVGVVPAITLASPIKVAHRAIPTIMIIVSLVLWFLPTGLDLAMMCVPIAAWISSKLGIEHAGHEPADYAPAVAKAKTVATAAREKVRPPKPIEVTEFVTKDSAGVLSDEDELADADTAAAEDDDLDDAPEDQEPEAAPAETVADKLELAAMGLPAEYQARLAGQRPGKMSQPGLRDQHTLVRSFIPAL
jgi:hypothetical protein